MKLKIYVSLALKKKWRNWYMWSFRGLPFTITIIERVFGMLGAWGIFLGGCVYICLFIVILDSWGIIV